MGLFDLFHKAPPSRKASSAPFRFRPSLEGLESRIVPYSLSGDAWPNSALVTLSFVPDGTILGSGSGGYIKSNLFSTFNAKFGSPAAWQGQILKAAQVWAQQTNLNFAVVPDRGAAIGSGSDEQGDATMGDIRIGGYNFGNQVLAQAYMPPPDDNYSIAGDVQLNTGQNFNIGSTYDLFTVMVHEIGHSLGLEHSRIVTADMYANYTGMKTTLAGDDISGIRAIYSHGSPRTPDAYNATGAGNATFPTAADISGVLTVGGSGQKGSKGLAGVVNNLDITTPGQVEYFQVVAPAGTTGTFTVTMQSSGLSLLDPELTVYAANQTTVLAQGAGPSGGAVTLTISGVTAGQKLYLRAYSDGSAFGVGRYALALNFGNGPMPAVASASVAIGQGDKIHFSGGQNNSVALETQVNTTTAGIQQTAAESPQAVAMDAAGNYVVVWQSSGQDGSGWGIYAQRFDLNNNPLGSEFQVNTTTAGDQTEPTVAMDPAGDFVVAWQSHDSDGWGIFAQRFNAAGVPQGTEFQVNTTTAGDQMYPGVAMDGSGNFVVTWSSSGQDGSGWGVYAQRFSAAGVPQGGEFRVNSTTAGDQMFSSVAMDANGNFAVVWQSNGQDGSGWGVYGQLYNAAGLTQGGEFQVNTTTAGDQEYATVAMSPGGSFLVTWSSYGQDGSGWGVYANQFDAQGNDLSGEFPVNTTTAGDQKFSSMALDLFGHAIAVWSGAGATDNAGVFSQSYLLRDGAGSSFMTPDGYSAFGDEADTGGDDGAAQAAALQMEAGVMLAADFPASPAGQAGTGGADTAGDDAPHARRPTRSAEAHGSAAATETKAQGKLTAQARDRAALLRKVYDTLFADQNWMSYT